MRITRGLFYVSTIGIVLSVIFREKFDGVAFLFFIIAAAAFAMNLYLETVAYDKGVSFIQNDIDQHKSNGEL